MKSIHLCFLLVYILVQQNLFAQGNSSLLYTDYRPDYRKWTENYLLDKIEYRTDRMILFFRLVASSGMSTFYGVKGESPWFLDTKGKDVEMLGVKNIVLDGELQAETIPDEKEMVFRVSKGQIITCEIHFPRLKAGLNEVNLIEGRGYEKAENHFNCLNIKIKSFGDNSLGSEGDMVGNIQAFEKQNRIAPKKVPDTQKKKEPDTKIMPEQPVPITSEITVHFEKNRAELSQDEHKKLLALREEGTKILQITGYTDDSGSSELNQQLAKKRAHAVQSIIGMGGLLEVKGEEDPLVPNSSEENRVKNRRVVVRYTK